MQSYHVVAACAGYTRNAVTSKTLTLISGAPETRAQHSLLNSESGVVTVEKERLEAVGLDSEKRILAKRCEKSGKRGKKMGKR